MNLNYTFIDKIKALPFVDEMILFGSRARGDQKERSDIDLAVVCPKASDKDWQTLLKEIENKDTLLKVDAVRYDELRDENPLKQSIDKDGVILYRRCA